MLSASIAQRGRDADRLFCISTFLFRRGGGEEEKVGGSRGVGLPLLAFGDANGHYAARRPAVVHYPAPQRCITQPWGLSAREERGWDASEPENISMMGCVGQCC